jgi:hypothetical protein
MRNAPTLPVMALVVAAVVAAFVVVMRAGEDGPLSELELGGVAWAIGLAIYGVQGLISVALEGRELRPGRVPPRLTGPLSALIVLFSLALFGVAVLLGIGLTGEWDVEALGWLAGGGCLILALLLVFYKEAFLGDEATFDNRDDGIPW